jgi:hypothetical protein
MLLLQLIKIEACRDGRVGRRREGSILGSGQGVGVVKPSGRTHIDPTRPEPICTQLSPLALPLDWSAFIEAR